MRPTIFLAILALPLAACQQAPESGTSDTVQPDAAQSPMPVEPDGGIGDGATPPAGDEVANASIPSLLQGRWGLVPADCTSTKGDAKGLITVGADSIRFYESLGKLGEVAERDTGSIRASFAFSGEGMTWDRDMRLETSDGGKTLVRTEYGEEAMAEPLHYSKCA